jgi:membrane-bound lytic murein transglycosylase D
MGPSEADDEAGEYKGIYDDSYGGFCSDDIFSEYLRHEYMTREASRSDRLSAREAKRNLIKTGSKAQFYARSILAGPSAPYFGGLPVVPTPSVEMWVHYYKTKGREQFIKWMVRGEIYKELVAAGLYQEGLPRELFYLAMIESGFSNTASSRVRATGTWQFMKPTAQHYGLKIDYWVDERRDPVKSTIAAARFLRDLYAKFGDWYLAMAAYNAGPGKIARAIRHTKSRDFWTIARSKYITQETKQYVPKMLAALIISSNPLAHGFKVEADKITVPNLTTVPIKRPTHLAAIASKLEIPYADLKSWNPELLRSVTPPRNAKSKGRDYELRLSRAVAERFLDLQDTIASLDIRDVTLHEIRSGETLGAIARRYAVPVAKILAVNPDLKPQWLSIGRTIAIPVPEIVAHL